jgi:flagellar FliL protein
MADEQKELNTEEKKPRVNGGMNKKLYLIIAVLIVVIGGGIGGYFALSGGKDKGGDKGSKEGKSDKKSALVAIDPFVVNLSEHGRYLKVTMQFEVGDEGNQPLVAEKTPNIRDAIITLLSSKSAESVSGPEGKFQLKDEILLRANQAVGKDIFKNLFFTEFVMQ